MPEYLVKLGFPVHIRRIPLLVRNGSLRESQVKELVVTDRCMGFECSATEITTQLRQCVTYLRRLIVIANYV